MRLETLALAISAQGQAILGTDDSRRACLVLAADPVAAGTAVNRAQLGIIRRQAFAIAALADALRQVRSAQALARTAVVSARTVAAVIARRAGQRHIYTARGRHARVRSALIAVIAVHGRPGPALAVQACIWSSTRIPVVAGSLNSFEHTTHRGFTPLLGATVIVVAIHGRASRDTLAFHANVTDRARITVITGGAHHQVDHCVLVLVAPVSGALVAIICGRRRIRQTPECGIAILHAIAELTIIAQGVVDHVLAFALANTCIHRARNAVVARPITHHALAAIALARRRTQSLGAHANRVVRQW